MAREERHFPKNRCIRSCAPARSTLVILVACCASSVVVCRLVRDHFSIDLVTIVLVFAESSPSGSHSECTLRPASYQFVHDAANGRCTDREGLLRISSYQPYDTPMSPISLGPSMTAIETHNAHSLAALAWDSAPRAFDPTYRSGAASRDVSNRLFAAAASFKSASKLSGGLPSSNIPLNVA